MSIFWRTKIPTEAFFKLNEVKKNQLIDSAIREFSSLPYEKVSIFKIAQNAEVSRSGFYYYFKDKKDIYEYLINDIKNEFIEKYIDKTKTINIFELGNYLFHFFAEIKGSGRESLFRNIVQNTKPDDIKMIFSLISEPNKPCDVNFSMDGMCIESHDQINGIVMYMATGIMYSVSGYLDDEYSYETAESKLEELFNIIKYGVLKGEKGA